MDSSEIKIFEHNVDGMIHSGGNQYTPNDFSDLLCLAVFNSHHEADFAIKTAGFVAAFEQGDKLDSTTQARLLQAGMTAIRSGQQ